MRMRVVMRRDASSAGCPGFALTTRAVCQWFNMSALAGAAGQAVGTDFYIASIPPAGKGELYVPDPLYDSSRGGQLRQGAQITANALPFRVADPLLVMYYPPPHEFSCSVCEDDGTSCSVCVPYTYVTFYVERGGFRSNLASLGIIVKQNSDAPFAGGGGGALFLDGYDDFALARMTDMWPHALTVTMWAKNMRVRPLQTIFSIFSSRGRELEVYNTMDLQVLRGLEESTPPVGKHIADGSWHHIAVALDARSGRCTLLVDGETVSSAVFAPGVPLAREAELIVGQRPICGATSERQRRLNARSAALLAPYNVSQADGSTYRVCASEIPQQNCEVYHPEVLRDTYIWAQDNEEVLKRGSDPEAPMVEPGAWRCAFQDRVCTQGAAAVMDAFACSCAPGCMEPKFSFHGYIDEIRLYSVAKSPLQVSLDARLVIGDVGVGAGIGRAAIHWQNLFLYYTFDNDGKALDGGSRREPSMRADSESVLILGGDFEQSLPQRVESTAPIMGAYDPLSLPMDGSSATLLKIPIYGNNVPIDVVRCRIVEPIPVYGIAYTVNPRP